MKTEFSSPPLPWTSWWHVQTSNKIFMAPSIPRAPINTHPLPHPPPRNFPDIWVSFFSLIIATPWWVQLIHSNPQCGASGRVQNSVEKLKCLTLFRVSHSWSLYFIICHVELWFRKCKLNRGHNPQAQMYQLKFTYRIYSNKRPTSNKRPPRISAHPKGRKS